MIRRDDFGVPFALHASREIDESVYDRIEKIAPDLQLLPSIMGAGTVLAARAAPEWYRLSRITSAVIAVATIDKVFDGGWDTETIARHADLLSDSRGVPLGPDQVRWFCGPIGYVLRDIRALATPVPCRGWQGFWHLTPRLERERNELSAVELAVIEQIATTA